jgi:hypothetical protein
MDNIEADQVNHLAEAAKITLSGYCYSSVAHSLSAEIKTANAKNIFSPLTSRAAANWVLAGTGWQYFTLSYSNPHADVANGIQLSFYQASCTSGTFGITGVQLEAGEATPYEHRPVAIEQQLCHRYLRTLDVMVPATTAQNLGVIDMYKTPSITGGGAGFTSTGTTKDNLIAYQTTGAVQTLQLKAYP